MKKFGRLASTPYYALTTLLGQFLQMEINAELLTPKRVAEHLGMQVGTLAKWRWKGSGPSFIKVGSRIRYRRSDIEDYIRQCSRKNTSDSGI